MNIHSEICKTFDRHASEYEKNALVQTEIGNRLFERLDYLKMSPKYVLDLGCGSGLFSQLLKIRYPEAQIIGFDLSFAMLNESRQKQTPNSWFLVAGNMESLPFESGMFDLVFANQVIHWASSMPQAFREINRVLKAEGCLMFTTLGPDTFVELKQAWQKADNAAHVNVFQDMHDIGDMLMHEYFMDPVMDMEMLTIHYPEVSSLVKGLKAQGVRNINTARNQGLTGKTAWKIFENAYQTFKTPEGKIPLSYEVIYGHAWKGNQGRGVRGVETFIPISRLTGRRR